MRKDTVNMAITGLGAVSYTHLVTPDVVLAAMWKSLFTDAQRESLKREISTEYANLFIDSADFVFTVKSTVNEKQVDVYKRQSETSPIDEAVRTLDGLLEKPYLIAQRLSLYKAQIDAVANQSAYLSSQPLELDTLELLPVEEASHRRTCRLYTSRCV